MSRPLVMGDPASVSGAGGQIAAAGHTLHRHAHAVSDALPPLATGWTGTMARRSRAQLTALGEALDSAGDQFSLAGSALQQHATTLSHLSAQARAVIERAQAAGFDVTAGRVSPRFAGLTSADADRENERARQRQALQDEVDTVLRGLTLERERLISTLGSSASVLRRAATSLRP